MAIRFGTGLLLGTILLGSVSAWVPQQSQRTSVCRRAAETDDWSTSRRAVLQQSVAAALLLPMAPAHAVTRAVGGAEIECREQGNCLERGELDGALGWNWGGKDRCDASDPQCGPDGKLRGAIVGQPVPRDNLAITHVATIRVDVGREETNVLRLGFYGREAPASVQQMVDFLSETGIATLDRRNMMGADVAPVTLLRGGVLDSIVPGQVIDFGVPSQVYAYARSRGVSKAEGFVPQPRPSKDVTSQDGVTRPHDAAGLLSVSKQGLGYGGTGFESDDEAFESSFLITAAALPALDKTRRVIGRVLDAESMAFLERLASLPTKRGIRGVIPGQTSGPPLLKTVVREIAVAEVTNAPK